MGLFHRHKWKEISVSYTPKSGQVITRPAHGFDNSEIHRIVPGNYKGDLEDHESLPEEV